MTSATTAPPETGPEERPPGAPWAAWTTRRKVWTLVIAGLVVWLVGGLVQVALLQSKAAKAQTELQAFRDALQVGDASSADDHLAAGKWQLARARDAANFGPVRVAKHLPWLGDTVNDLDHVLAAADQMTQAGGEALNIYDRFSGDDAELFKNDTVDLSAVRQARESSARIATLVKGARRELRDVHGQGPQGARILAKKRAALRQITKLSSDIASLQPVLRAMPSALGADGVKTYLVAVLNPAEMRASGGAPLSVAFVRFENGKMTIPVQGTTSELTGTNQKVYTDKLPGDPWQVPGAAQKFVNTNFNPSFPMSAEQMIRASPVNFGQTADGVVALDIFAVQRLLRATGPIQVDGYGALDANNVVDKLLVEPYKTEPTPDQTIARHDVNERLMTIMMSRLTEGGGLIGKARELGGAFAGRHLQMYFRDARLQRMISKENLGGAVPAPAVGNLSAVYSQNTNQSKMDIFQQRTVRETVQMNTDGSAVVHRSVEILNESPPYAATTPDAKIGYSTRWAGSQVINLMPPGATITEAPSADTPGSLVEGGSVGQGTDQDGRTFGQARILLPPGAITTLTWSYVVPHAAVPQGNGLRLLDFVAPQSMLHPPNFELTILPPPGWIAHSPVGWTPSPSGAMSVTTTMDHSSLFYLDVVPAG